MVVSVSNNDLLVPAQAEAVGRVELAFTLTQLAELASDLHSLHPWHQSCSVHPEQSCVRVFAQAPLVDLQSAQVARHGGVASVAAGQAVVATAKPGSLAVKVNAWRRRWWRQLVSLETGAAGVTKVLAVKSLELLLLLHRHLALLLSSHVHSVVETALRLKHG